MQINNIDEEILSPVLNNVYRMNKDKEMKMSSFQQHNQYWENSDFE